MKNIELQNYGVQELSFEEAKAIDGGSIILALLIGFWVGAFFSYVTSDPFNE